MPSRYAGWLCASYAASESQPCINYGFEQCARMRDNCQVLTEQTTVPATEPARRARVSGIGRVLIFLYGTMALAATGRSVVQVIEKFDQAPLAYSLSVLAAVVYIVATVALVLGPRAHRLAWITISFELAVVLIIGTLSIAVPSLFPHDTVWSYYGLGYAFVPLVLPLLGMWWLRSQGRAQTA